MIKVKWLKAHFKFAYSAGNVGFVTAEWAEKLLAEGYVILIPEAEKYMGPVPANTEVLQAHKYEAPIPQTFGGEPESLKKNLLPEDLPGRDKLFDAGFDSIEKIKSVADGDGLLDVISNSILKKVKKYLKG